MSHGVVITGGGEKSAMMDEGIICVELLDKNQTSKHLLKILVILTIRNFQFAGVRTMPSF